MIIRSFALSLSTLAQVLYLGIPKMTNDTCSFFKDDFQLKF